LQGKKKKKSEKDAGRGNGMDGKVSAYRVWALAQKEKEWRCPISLWFGPDFPVERI
jgi:hypothetical protein